MSDNKFISPIQDEEISFRDINSPKDGIFKSNNTNIVCPYDGVVVDTGILERGRHEGCKDGYYRIEHMIDDKIFYSNFCNISPKTIIHPPNSIIKKRKKIGETERDNLYYWITDKENNKKNIINFLKGKVVSDTIISKPEDEKNKEEKKDNNKKEEEKKINKNKENKNTDNIPQQTSSSGYKKLTAQDYQKTPHPGMDLMTLPIRMLGNVLKEEISRIKELMK